jgi:DNA adenine methylase
MNKAIPDAPMRIDPAFGYFGSKHRLASKISALLPRHAAWVEAFCGSAAVTLSKRPADLEVINDLDGEVVNLFKQLRDNSEELLRRVALTPYARQEYLQARLDRAHDDAIEQARRFLVASMMSVNGAVGSEHAGFSFSDSYERGGREARVNRWYQLPERLAAVVERLRNVRVEKWDAIKLLKNHVDRPGSLVYLDPPYLMERRHGYTVDANSEEFHQELLAMCKKTRCMILLSGYANPLYSRILKPCDGWRARKLTTKTRGTDGVDLAREEMLWMNEPFQRASRNGRIPVSRSASERAIHKVNPRRSRS